MKYTTKLLGLLLALVSSSSAQQCNSNEFRFGYYTEVKAPERLPSLVTHGVDTVIPYIATQSLEVIRTFLDKCEELGIGAYPQVSYNGWANGSDKKIDLERTRTLVEAFADHPAVIGWYTSDEAILFASPKFYNVDWDVLTKRILNSRQVILDADPYDLPQLGVIAKFDDPRVPEFVKKCFDIWAYDRYPYRTITPDEFGNYEEGVQKIRQFADIVKTIGKPNMYIGQGQARELREGVESRLRFPTYNEHLWQVMYSQLTLASSLNRGYNSWAYYRTVRAKAQPDMPYPGTGLEWLEDVFDPVMKLYRKVGPAMLVDPVKNLSDNDSFDAKLLLVPCDAEDVDAESHLRFPHPYRSIHFIVAVNHGTAATTKTFDLSSLGYELGFVSDLGNPSDSAVVAMSGTTVQVKLPPKIPVVLQVPLQALVNRGFEQGTDSWVTYGGADIETTTAIKYGGKQGLKVFNRSGESSGARQSTTKYMRQFGMGAYKIGGRVYVESDKTETVMVTLEFRGKGDPKKTVRTITKNIEPGKFVSVSDVVQTSWKGDLWWGRINVQLVSTKDLYIDSMFTWKTSGPKTLTEFNEPAGSSRVVESGVTSDAGAVAGIVVGCFALGTVVGAVVKRKVSGSTSDGQQIWSDNPMAVAIDDEKAGSV